MMASMDDGRQQQARIEIPTIHIMNDFAGEIGSPSYNPRPAAIMPAGGPDDHQANDFINYHSNQLADLPTSHSTLAVAQQQDAHHEQLQQQEGGENLPRSSGPPFLKGTSTAKARGSDPPALAFSQPLRRFSSNKSSKKDRERRRTTSTASTIQAQQLPSSPGHLQIQIQDFEDHHHTLTHRPSQAFSATSAPPLDFYDLSTIYTVVASRRDSYDNLLWQCPTLALTAQSFLFSIALDGETTRVARIISMLLSIVITTCSLQLFTRQLAAEQADRQWLINFETRHGVPYEDTAFGENWDKYSQKLPESAGFIKVLALTGSFPLWRNSLFIFLGAAISVLAISFIRPSLFEGGDSRRGAG